MARRSDPIRYGTAHRAMRAAWAPVVARGEAACTRCHQTIHPGQRWDLDHIDGGTPDQYAGPAHARCNRRAGAQHGNAARSRRRPTTSEAW